MLLTLSGIVMLLRSVQPENAQEPMLETLLGIVILMRLVQLEKAELQMTFAFPEIEQRVIDWFFAFTNTI